MIKSETIEPGDILYSDDEIFRSILVVAIQPLSIPVLRYGWYWEMWWLDRTSVSGCWMTTGGGPVGPWRFDNEIPWHRERSEWNVHHEDGDPEGD